MGSDLSCCRDGNLGKSDITDFWVEPTQQNYSNHFYKTEMPNDQLLQKKIQIIKQDQTFAQELNNPCIMKHKFLDKYYIGKLNQKNEPEGLGIMFEPDNYIYHGEFNVVPSGEGTLQLLKEELIYKGQIKDGRANGQGILKSSDGRLQFQGTMKNSYPKSGILKINNLSDPTKSYIVTLDDFPNKPSKISYGDGRTYQGFVSKRSFAPLGKGTAYFPDSSYYQGEWEEGQMHGRGYFHWKDGTSYNGDYQHGRKHGNGVFTYLSKKYYEGEWAGGRQNGKGKLLDPSGKILKEGIWKDGVLEREES